MGVVFPSSSTSDDYSGHGILICEVLIQRDSISRFEPSQFHVMLH